MLLASYHSTRPGWQGIANRLIRLRLRGQYSHSELVFEPGDGVDALMPDGSCQPDADGALWCASSVAAEALPAFSARRPGRTGGVRFKRIRLEAERWDVVPLAGDTAAAARWFREREGARYDWQLILGFVSWLIPNKAWRWTCSEAVAAAAGFEDPHRFDPCVLHAAAKRCCTPV